MIFIWTNIESDKMNLKKWMKKNELEKIILIQILIQIIWKSNMKGWFQLFINSQWIRSNN